MTDIAASLWPWDRFIVVPHNVPYFLPSSALSAVKLFSSFFLCLCILCVLRVSVVKSFPLSSDSTFMTFGLSAFRGALFCADQKPRYTIIFCVDQTRNRCGALN
jgi:hypothetical protein